MNTQDLDQWREAWQQAADLQAMLDDPNLMASEREGIMLMLEHTAQQEQQGGKE